MFNRQSQVDRLKTQIYTMGCTQRRYLFLLISLLFYKFYMEKWVPLSLSPLRISPIWWNLTHALQLLPILHCQCAIVELDPKWVNIFAIFCCLIVYLLKVNFITEIVDVVFGFSEPVSSVIFDPDWGFNRCKPFVN